MTDKRTTEQLSCPFCGASGYIAEHNHGYYPTAKHDRNCPMAQMSFPESEFYIKPEFAVESWNTRAELGSGTLTAKQVSKATYAHSIHADCADADWQAIADELNAELGSGTCEPKWTLQGKTQTQEFWRCECGNCGEWFGVEDRSSFPLKITIDKVDIPNFCPNCGKRVSA